MRSPAPTIQAIGVDDRWHVFTPIPTRSYSPAVIDVARATTEGITFTGSGWAPGSEFYVKLWDCAGSDGDPVYKSMDVRVDAEGRGELTVVLPPDIVPTAYCVFVDDNSYLYHAFVLEEFQIDIVAEAPAASVGAGGVPVAVPTGAPASRGASTPAATGGVSAASDLDTLAATGAQDVERGLAIGAGALLLGTVVALLAARRRAASS